MILTKSSEKSKRNKKRVEIRKRRYIESDRTYYYIEKFNSPQSVWSSRNYSLFSKNFLDIAEIS